MKSALCFQLNDLLSFVPSLITTTLGLKANESINDDIISKEIIPMIKKVAKKNKLDIIDLHTAMDGIPQLFPDKIHPNEEGAKIMAKTVYESIRK